MTKPVTIAITAFLIFIALSLVWAYQEYVVPRQTTAIFELRELGVEIEIPEYINDLTYEVRTESVGPVLHMTVDSLPGCHLGNFSTISKNNIPASGYWTEERLEQAQLEQNNIPPQVKEFPNFYLVFEPSQTVCIIGSNRKAEEIQKRFTLWNTLGTARLL